MYPHSSEANKAVAGQIADLIRQRAAEGRQCVLGLATGSTPVGVYDELVRLHREEGLSLANVVTFNLDEYYPDAAATSCKATSASCASTCSTSSIFAPGNWHVPDGTLPIEQVADYCRWYEEQIAKAGGIDIQLLGIGRTGHIGFNEPGSGKQSRTRLITLDRVTRIDAASDFFGQENVPRRAITMGVGTILDARQIIMLAFGEHKAPIIAKAVEGEVSPTIAASFLQEHPNAQVVLDEAAADCAHALQVAVAAGPGRVGRSESPQGRDLAGPQARQADPEAHRRGLQRRRPAGSAGRSRPGVRHQRQGVPPPAVDDHRLARRQAGARQAAGRPHATRTTTSSPSACSIFSPHPDDDVISMGGTLIRLVDQGHEVHVAYQTSGNIAVFDDDAIRFADFVAEFNTHFDVSPQRTAELEAHVEEFLRNKKPGQVDSPEVQTIKAMIRRGEARAAGRCCGVPGRAAALHGHAVLRNGPREEEAARRRGHRAWSSTCCGRFGRTRSTRPATCPIRTARIACA